VAQGNLDGFFFHRAGISIDKDGGHGIILV
jgi:hypothetical protein